MIKKFPEICSKLLFLLFLVIVFIIFISRLFISIQFGIFDSQLADARIYYFFNFYTIIFVFVILFLLKSKFLNYITNKIKDLYWYILFFLIPVFIGLVFLFAFGYGIGDDALSCFDVAKTLANGIKLSELTNYSDYLKIVPYQYGFVNVLRFFVIAFKENAILFYQMFQVIMYGIANVYLYKITKFISDENNNLTFLLLNILWIVPYLISPYVYGFSLGLSLSIISLYYFFCFIKTKKYYFVAISFVLALLASYIKMNYTIIIIAYVIYMIVFYKEKIIKKIILSIITTCCLVLSLNIIYLSAIIIDGQYLPKGSSLISWLVMGSPDNTLFDEYGNYVTPGYFTGYSFEIAEENNYITEQINNEVYSDLGEVINYVITNPKKALEFYYYKFISTWDVADYNTFYYAANHGNSDINNTIINSLNDGFLNIFLTQLINVGTILILLGSIMYFLSKIKIKQQYTILIILWFIGGCLYHLLFETKGIYVYPYLTILTPISSIGISSFIKNNRMINTKINKKFFIVMAVSCVLLALIFNTQKFIIPFYESYVDVIDNNFLYNYSLSYKIPVNADTNINTIEIGYSGRLNSDNAVFKIISDNNVIYSNTITQNNLDNNSAWIKINGLNLDVNKDKEYIFKINVYGDNNDFKVTIGPSQWANGELYIDNNRLEGYVLNLKLFEKVYSKPHYYQNVKNEYVNNLYYKLW